MTGVVQGVGFRPFVYHLARTLELNGWVLNDSSGVEIEVVGPPHALDLFTQRLQSEAPPLARIDHIAFTDLSGTGHPVRSDPGAFVIRHSEATRNGFLPVSPDVAVCDDCLRELFDPRDRRYRYPFINCTNCGPRFTIIRDIPYDRPQTTMASFRMCPDCQDEYENPGNRRFHAQPNACAVCGPQIWFLRADQAMGTPGQPVGEDALRAARASLAAGQIVAIKGLGGFHLACDATNDEAVTLLRERKGRIDKPFALMSFDLDTVEGYCEVSAGERALLESRERPIVLLRRHRNCQIVSSHVAPGTAHLGVMLPYTPLHYLLLEPTGSDPPFPLALVMTSGNRSEEPIATDNDEAKRRLGRLADAFLFHDRRIHARCDDSVTRFFAGAELPTRRSRGYAPYPVHLPWPVDHVLATGAELKNTFCITRDRYAFLSQHIGDMENYETFRFSEQMIQQFLTMFRIEPQIIAHDMHPAYLTTQWARGQLPSSNRPQSEHTVAVQHHHAHIAACMAEHGLTGAHPIIGVALDGTGYGTDGAIWGGEFLIADYASYQRIKHLRYVPLPGGDAAIRHPRRIALAYLWAAGIPWTEDLPAVRATRSAERDLLAQQLDHNVNTVLTSSMGRLFDAVSSLIGVRHEINYEGQAAIELEAIAQDDNAPPYKFEVGPEIDATPVIQAIVADIRRGTSAHAISARFHSAVAHMVTDACRQLRMLAGASEVALSGGVFQNVVLLRLTTDLLQQDGYTVYTHHIVPPNDAGVSLGQAMVANARINKHRSVTACSEQRSP